MLVTMLVIVYSYEIFVCNVMCMLVPRFLGQFECMTEHRPWGHGRTKKRDPIFFKKMEKKYHVCYYTVQCPGPSLGGEVRGQGERSRPHFLGV